MTDDTRDLLRRLAELVRYEHDDHTVAEEAADVIRALEAELEQAQSAWSRAAVRWTEQRERLEARLSLAHSFRVGRLCGNPVRVERCQSRDGVVVWAVRGFGDCWNRVGEWEYEPLPSNRDDAFLHRCRWANMDEAFAAAEAALAWEPK